MAGHPDAGRAPRPAADSRYTLYGFSVDAGGPLPGLSAVRVDGPADVRLTMGRIPHAFSRDLGADPWYVSPRDAGEDEPSVVVHRAADGGFRLRYADGIEVWVDASASHVAAAWPERWSVEDALTYVLGAGFGLVLRLRGIPALHASAIQVDGGAIALTGPAGAGKSTTAAAFAARGHRILADDVAALRVDGGCVRVQPAYPHLRLWPDVIPALHGPGADLPPLTPNWEKRYMDLDDAGAFGAEPLPLRAVYVLAGREAENAPRIEPIAPAEAVLTLAANQYLGWFPLPDARAGDFRVLARVAAAVPVLRVVPHADPARLGALVDRIAADAAARA